VHVRLRRLPRPLTNRRDELRRFGKREGQVPHHAIEKADNWVSSGPAPASAITHGERTAVSSVAKTASRQWLS